jgi:cystathionine beta-lyase
MRQIRRQILRRLQPDVQPHYRPALVPIRHAALEVAHWLQKRPEVATVFCPALPQHPGHDIWKRDCSGTNGLLSIELQPGIESAAVERFVDALRLFGRGSSWGGYESLVAWTNMRAARSVTDWNKRGAVVRLHIGLEAPEDLTADLAHGFDAMNASARKA